MTDYQKSLIQNDIASIDCVAQWLLERTDLTALQRNYLEEIRACAAHIKELVNG